MAHAQTKALGFALDRYNPAESGSEWLFTDSLDIFGNVRPSVRIDGQYAYRPLIIDSADKTERASVVRHLSVLHIGGSLTFFDRLRIGVTMPIPWYADGDGGSVGGYDFTSPVGDGIGDVRAGADVRVLGRKNGIIRLAVGSQLFLPSGTQKGYMGDGKVRALPRLLAAGDAYDFAYAAQVGFHYRPLNDPTPGSPKGNELMFGASFGRHFVERTVLVGVEVSGWSAFSDMFGRQTTAVEGILTGRYAADEEWSVSAGIGTGFDPGYGAPTLRAVLNLVWSPVIGKPDAPAAPAKPAVVADPDRDHDSIPDKQDACPDAAGAITTDPKTSGCPATPAPTPPPGPTEPPAPAPAPPP